MSILTILGIFIVLAWSFLYTLSYGKWTWKNKNPLGAIMILILGLLTLGLPIYSIFFREQ